MTDGAAPPLSRDELLGGLSARRAATVLFTIQSRVAHLALRSRQAVGNGLEQQTAESQERTFLAAVAAGRDQPTAPRIQDLERFAPDVAPLIPSDALLRADVASRLASQYDFRARDIPRLRAALGLDTAEVSAAFERHFGRPIESIYAYSLGTRDRCRWAQARLARRVDELPPFWMAFALTLTEMVGAGALALPIALARVGPLGGVVLLIVLGLINMLTITALAEAFTRSGEVRFGGAYFGGLVRQYLGRPGAVMLSVALVLLCSIVLLAFVIGLASTLREVTNVDSTVWALAMLALLLVLVRGKSLGGTVASSIAAGALNVFLLLVMSFFALAHLDASNLTAIDIPGLAGPSRDEPFDPAVLELVFGVVLVAFFGHTSMGYCAPLVLRADPGGRSLIRGTAAATGTAIVMYCIWVFTVGGAIDAQRLADEESTAIGPLADVAGPAVLLLGTVFVIADMGITSVHLSYGLTRQTREWLKGHRFAEVLALAPLFAVYVLAIVQLRRGEESFTEVLALVGVTIPPLLAGVFPILLVTAGRRRGELVPAVRAPLLANLVVCAVLWVFFVGSVVLHGVVIFDSPLLRLVALGIAVVTAIVTVLVVRSRLLDARVTIEVRADDELGLTFVSVFSAGETVPADIILRRPHDEVMWDRAAESALPDRVTSLSVTMEDAPPGGLQVWAHRVGLDGISRPLAVRASLSRGDAAPDALVLENGRAVADLAGDPWTLEVAFDRRSVS